MLRFADRGTSYFFLGQGGFMLRLISQSSYVPGKSPLSCYIQRFRKVPTRLLDKWFCFRFTGLLSPTLRLEVSCYVYTFAKFQPNMRSGS
jgi:hypothetical protein